MQHSWKADEMRLPTAVKALNDTNGLIGMVPVLLVYGTLPRIALNPDGLSLLSHAGRLALVRTARNTADRIVSRLRIQEAERHNTPSSADDLSFEDLVYVWRERRSEKVLLCSFIAEEALFG
jgi:hypothetical protein